MKLFHLVRLMLLLWTTINENMFDVYGFVMNENIVHSHNQNNKIQKKNPLFITTAAATTTLTGWQQQQLQQQQRHRRIHNFSVKQKEAVQSILFSSSMDDYDMLILPSTSPTIIVMIALFIGILANVWISSLINGKQGLGSYLSDGSGYNKSKFQPLRPDSDRAVQNDPLPWLQLPKLDFVEVAGQQQQQQQELQQRRRVSTSSIASPTIGASEQEQAKKFRTSADASTIVPNTDQNTNDVESTNDFQ